MGLLVLLLAAALSSALSPPGLAVAGLAAGRSVPAIFVFGDSTADVGNNNHLPGNQAKANFPFNGIDYPLHKPTGRFSNGYNGVDFIAKRLGFTESPPAYLSITSDEQIFEGVNFASGGSGVLDATGQSFSVSMNTQIGYFRAVTNRLNKRLGNAAAGQLLEKSLFVFSTANNDMFAFFSSTGHQNGTQGDQFIQMLANQFRNQLEMLYQLGARKFVVFGSSLLGCIPFLRRTTPSGDCVEPLNQFSRQFNEVTKTLLRGLAAASAGMSYTFVNSYDFISLVSSQPLKYGFKEIKSACCGSGRLNADAPCTSNATCCSDRRAYASWDQFHPTEAAYKLVSDLAFQGGPKFAMPANVRQLAGHGMNY